MTLTYNINMFQANIILDSIAPSNYRLTTFALTYPRFIHAEFMTHRVFSRNASSSRAIPVSKMIETLKNDYVEPTFWGKNQKGMQAESELNDAEITLARSIWLKQRDNAIEAAQALADLGCHKQITNRILEPFMNITVICTATDYDNFFSLRCHPDAQPEIQKLAYMMKDALEASTPTKLYTGEWHIPYIQPDEQHMDLEIKKKISVARCARVSYLTHDGKRDIDKDIELYERLIGGSGKGHWSPFEHVAMAIDAPTQSGNFHGWVQYRKFFVQEYQGQ